MKEIETTDIDLLGGRVVDPSLGIDEKRDLFIRDGIVLYEPPSNAKPERVLNLKGDWIFPGMFDLRTHARVPGSAETISSVTKSAAKGGYTGILAMPDTTPKSDNPGTIRFVQDRIKQDAVVPVYLAGCLTMNSAGEMLAPLGSLKESGIIAATDYPYSSADNQIYVNAIKYASMFGLKIIEFPVDSYLTGGGMTHESPLSLKMGLRGYPRMAEELSVQRAITISKNLDVSIHLSSISSEGSVSLIKEAKKSGTKITADVCTNHLLLNECAIIDYNTYAKMMPPLREERDRLALVNGVRDHVIDAICSGHEPWSDHAKNVEFDKAPLGAISLETSLLVALEALNHELSVVVNAMSVAPRKILNLQPETISHGKKANLVVIGKNKSWKYEPKNGMSNSNNSPYSGRMFKHSILLTVLDGKIIWAKN